MALCLTSVIGLTCMAGAADRSDLQLKDGRVLKGARITSYTETTVSIVHAGGIETFSVEQVPIESLALAYNEIQAAKENAMHVTATVEAKALAKNEAAISWRKGIENRPALIATGESNAKLAPENACIVMSTAEGVGTSFILRDKGGFSLVSNQHVISGGAPHRYEGLDGTVLKPGGGLLAKDRDLVIFDLPEQPSNYFEMEPDVNAVALGEDLIIYGNAKGAGIRLTKAKLVAKSKTEIEISGGFVQGNSGGPIIRAKTGKVIAVSTYLKIRRTTPRTITDIIDAAVLPKVQFYGTRIDNLRETADFTLPGFYGEYQALSADERRLERALQLVLLMSQKLKRPIFAKEERNADRNVIETAELLRWDKFYPGTINVVDLHQFQDRAAGFFAPISPVRSFIHVRRRAELEDLRAILVRTYADLLKSAPVR